MKIQLNKTYLILAIILFLIEVCIAIFLKTGFIRHTFGDYLVVFLLYCGLRGLTSLGIWRTAITVLIISFLIEFLQLTSILEVFNLENSRLAKLVFGTTFQFTDLVAYTLGVVTILFIETKLQVKLKLERFFKAKNIIVFGILFTILSISLPNYIIAKSAENKTFYKIEDIPKNKVGLVLGANKLTESGNVSLYYLYRVNAAVKLYKANKIEYVLVSGDNSRKGYNEPSMFKEDLIKKGIPEDKIFLDYAGFRTLDSVVRAKEIFGQYSITIISQRFHCQRAIYLAQAHNINAVGFNAKHFKKSQFFNKPPREYLARAKAVLDIITDKKPKFLGHSITIR
ncbi:DUF2809 domain-containing protein [uncultured Winogradskyella sp.]|uniref:DUF2809 domain-containing protein n=1 Tax=uncultured Winogradskyella sp. TaxID=395353 RepID=UPI00279637FB|nr:DUF2809 domain-containing protein [uncultured Winogradskyella sp.]